MFSLCQLGKDEAIVANQVLQFSFLGNTGFRFPFAHWPTRNTSPGALFFTFWKAVKWLLRNGFEVFYVCLDGSEVNRQFVLLHFKDQDPIIDKFTAINMHTRKPFIFLMDPEVKYMHT